MTGESVRLHRGCSSWPAGCLCMTAVLGLAVLSGPRVYAQATAPAPDPAAAPAEPQEPQGTQVQLEQVLSQQSSLTSEQSRDKLETLLAGDLTGVASGVKVRALAALASAYERLAQEARSDTLDPSAKARVELLIDEAADVLNRLGQAAVEGGDFPAAMQAFSRALSHRPGTPVSLLGLARATAKGGANPLLALENYESYLRAAKEYRVPIDPAIYMEMGKLYASANLWNQAMKLYEEAQRSGNASAELLGLLAEATMQLDTRGERKAKVIELAAEAAGREPENPVHSIRLVDLLLKLGQLPNNVWDPVYLGNALSAAQEAVRKAQQKLGGVAVSGSDAEVADSLQQLIDSYAVSVRAYTISLKLKPDELQTRVRLAALVRTQSEVQARLTAIQTLQMLEVGPTVEPTIELLEEKIRLQKMAQHKDLKATCDALLKLAPDNALAKETLAGLGQ